LATSEFDGTAAVAGPASFQKVSVGRQVLRRELNDRASGRHNGADEEFEVFCECGRAGCRDGVVITTSAYETLRRVPTHFLVKRSHAGPAERVVDSHEDFLIVEKFGRSGLEAIKLARGKRRLPSGSA
jgi:hypothetical protein